MTNDMSCAAIREEMLVAEIEDLRGIGESDVAKHVRTCDACAAIAQRLLGGHAQISAGLGSIKPRAKTRRRLLWIPIPLAAAAVIALLMIPRMQTEEALPNIDPIARMIFPEEPVVAPTPGTQAMVLEKDEMTIVWLYGQETP